jgi:hypothetical protein
MPKHTGKTWLPVEEARRDSVFMLYPPATGLEVEMTRQFLIPARDAEDASEAIARVPSIAREGDELVVLIVSKVPEGERVDSRPPGQVMDPLATTGGVSSEPRAAHDRPVMISREEIMEIKGREMVEALHPRIADLHDRGYGARVEAIFSDEPGAAIRDYAGDLNVTDVYLTSDFKEDLDDETQELVRTL